MGRLLRFSAHVGFALAGALACCAQQSPYAGSAACAACHAEVVKTFTGNPHFSTSAGGKEQPGKTGCEGCHGPGHAHAEQGAAITDFAALTPEAASATCLRCHGGALPHANLSFSEHARNRVSCLSCHSIHHPATETKLLATPQAQLCYQCHADVRAQFEMPFHHRVKEGSTQCTDCHNPHGSPAPAWRMADRPRMAQASLPDEGPCLKCHSDKRGPFAFEHPPVRVEGCEMCHSPHGSVNARLLRRPVVFTLCLECHNGAAPFGLRRTGDPNPSQAHNMADPRFQNCTSCHVRIHGSNNSPIFLR